MNNIIFNLNAVMMENLYHSQRVVAAELTRLASPAIVIVHRVRKPSGNIGEAEGVGSWQGRS